MWVLWHGVWSSPPTSTETHFLSSDLFSPPIHCAIFADAWRDNPGLNAYFLRAAFPSLIVEVRKDWEDRIASTSGKDRAWHFPILLLVDRSAVHRSGIVPKTHQIASEAWEFTKNNNQFAGERVGGWWDPIRHAIWRFAGVPDVVNAPSLDFGPRRELVLPMPDTIVITYISRQGALRRKLVEDDHNGLVMALQKLVEVKGLSWEFNVAIAEEMSKDEQIKAIARTTVRQVNSRSR